ncbi:MAG: MoaD/ThiS family protein [Planctomycetaceae bacterium]|nr:MoaD/ThiS family protein [Planctomycetaceae bacterium]
MIGATLPTVHFTSHLKLHVDCPSVDVSGESLSEVLNSVFEDNPRLRGYILDDQGRIRQHVIVFLDNEPIRERTNWDRPVTPNSEVYVLQALSGG